MVMFAAGAGRRRHAAPAFIRRALRHPRGRLALHARRPIRAAAASSLRAVGGRPTGRPVPRPRPGPAAALGRRLRRDRQEATGPWPPRLRPAAWAQPTSLHLLRQQPFRLVTARLVALVRWFEAQRPLKALTASGNLPSIFNAVPSREWPRGVGVERYRSPLPGAVLPLFLLRVHRAMFEERVGVRPDVTLVEVGSAAVVPKCVVQSTFLECRGPGILNLQSPSRPRP